MALHSKLNLTDSKSFCDFTKVTVSYLVELTQPSKFIPVPTKLKDKAFSYKNTAKNIPKKLNIKGVFFIIEGINSISMPTVELPDIYIELPQKVVPKPTKASLKQKPEKILPNAKTPKAKPILSGNSCTFCI